MIKKIIRQKNNLSHSLLILLPSLLLLLFLNIAVSIQASTSQVIGTVSITPLRINLKASKSVFVNKKFNLKAAIKNVGQDSIDNITLTLRLPAELALARGELVQDIGTLNSKKKKKVKWKVRALETGTHIIEVSASGTEQGTGEPVSTTAGLTIKVKQKRFYHSIFQSWLDFFNFLYSN